MTRKQAWPVTIAADVAEAWRDIRDANAPIGFGVHAVVMHAQAVAKGDPCGYYHRDDLVKAAAFLLEAIGRLDLSDDPPHECDESSSHSSTGGES